MGSGILVLCEHEDGAYKRTARELLGKAAELAGEVGGTVSALVVGHDEAGDLGQYGAKVVYTVTGDAFARHDTGPMVRALLAAVEAADPAVVLASASPVGKDVMPRLAARLGVGLATECTDLRAEGGKIIGRRPLYAGKVFADVTISTPLALFTVRANSFPIGAPSGSEAEVKALDVEVTEADLAARVVQTEAPSSSVVDLTEADRIVSGGRAVKSKEGFDHLIRPLAEVLGATPGASRAAVDAGYAPHSAQVGQTGKTVNPSLYIACGISGAIQHLAGMRTSRVIVAINTDPDAPIFQHATYGIVGDIFTYCPLLTGELKKALQS